MTEQKTFYHPETGRLLHLVPEGAKIPENMPYGYESGERFIWVSKGVYFDFTADGHTYFTAEPIRLPRPPLPTMAGSLIRATSNRGITCEVMALDNDGDWVGVSLDGDYRAWSPSRIADWSPVRVVDGDAS